MKTLKGMIAATILVFAGAAGAGDRGYEHGKEARDYAPGQALYDYARVLDVQPIYRELKVSTPVRECWEEPVYHTRQGQPKSAGGMLAGGLIGGIIGHQIGKGRGNKVATAVGTLIGAQIGHDAVNGHAGQHGETIATYEEHCKTRYRVDYEQIIDGYDVTYSYRGKSYRIEMPYDPGERIKMRIQITPVI